MQAAHQNHSHSTPLPTEQSAAAPAPEPETIALPLWLSVTEIEYLMSLCIGAPEAGGGVDQAAMRRLSEAWRALHRC